MTSPWGGHIISTSNKLFYGIHELYFKLTDLRMHSTGQPS